MPYTTDDKPVDPYQVTPRNAEEREVPPLVVSVLRILFWFAFALLVNLLVNRLFLGVWVWELW